MAEPLIITMLRSKRDEIEGAVVAYEKCLNEARANLAHVTATLRTFEASVLARKYRLIFALQLDCPFFGYELTGVSR